jgi:hypothetical protein
MNRAEERTKTWIRLSHRIQSRPASNLFNRRTQDFELALRELTDRKPRRSDNYEKQGSQVKSG